MKKWNESNFDECLNQAMETYTDLLVDNDFEDGDNFEYEIRQLIQKEDYTVEKMTTSDLEKYQSLHTGTYDLEDVEDQKRMHSGCIVIFYNDKANLIMDGNHRKNTHIETGSKSLIPVIKIFCKIIPKIQEPESKN